MSIAVEIPLIEQALSRHAHPGVHINPLRLEAQGENCLSDKINAFALQFSSERPAESLSNQLQASDPNPVCEASSDRASSPSTVSFELPFSIFQSYKTFTFRCKGSHACCDGDDRINSVLYRDESSTLRGSKNSKLHVH